jgi:protein KRI1
LVPREKTMDEVAREEEEYRHFLEKEVGDLRDLVDVGGDSAVAEPLQEEDGTKKKKKKKKENKGSEEGTSKAAGKSKQQEDQDFLVE